MSLCGDPLKFKGVCHFGTTNIINNIELNLKLRFDWSFLKVGAFVNVTKGMAGPLATGDWSLLKPIDDGYRWISIRKEWVYEDITYTDINSNTINPLSPAIYVNNVLQASGYTINYPEGMVIFETAQDITDTVQAAYSYRYVHTYVSDDVPWWKELQQNSFDLNSLHFTQSTCGDWNIGSEHRVQMPVIIIDCVPVGSLSGYALGETKRKATQAVLFHVFTESKDMRNKIVDIIRMQGECSFCTFNADYAAMDSALPIACGGDPTGLEYDDLVDTYPWANIWTGKPVVRALDTLKCGLFEARIDMPLEIIFIDCGV